MAVPDYQSLMLPFLKVTASVGGETSMAPVAEMVSDELKLSDDDRTEMLPSGKQSLLMNRLHWASTYLKRAGIIESKKRGVFQITALGQSVIRQNPKRIDVGFLNTFPEFKKWRESAPDLKPLVEAPEESPVSRHTPEDRITLAMGELNADLQEEILQQVLSSTPAFFERLIVNLLIAMGYGGGSHEMGRALGRSGDGGVDGVIKEDKLGLDVVYIQAKLYAANNAVAISEVRDFVGSLEGHQASKGVFVTTSKFPKSAYDFASRVSKRIVLINGDELAQLLIRHNVGVRTKDIYEIKRLDEDFFAE